MKKLISMIAVAAILSANVTAFAASPFQTMKKDTAMKMKMKKKPMKMKMKKKMMKKDTMSKM